VTLLADQALAHASLGHVGQSVELLTSAAQRNQRIRSAEKTASILRVRAVLGQSAGNSAVKAADEALKSAETAVVPQDPRASGR
jgi:ethanolamine utilization microcompartment shell protein EutL